MAIYSGAANQSLGANQRVLNESIATSVKLLHCGTPSLGCGSCFNRRIN